MKIKYDRIGKNYNDTRQADPYLVQRIVHHLSPLDGQRSRRVLDVGCGTGNYTCAIAAQGFELTGVDPSLEMLSVARERDPKINWLQASIESLDLDIGPFSAVVATLTLHHWDSLETGFEQIASLLEEHGRLVVFTSTPDQMAGYWLNHYFPRMMEASMVQMPTIEAVRAAADPWFQWIETEPYSVKLSLTDKFLYAGKDQPELYLSSAIRSGISSFQDLANEEEVSRGLAQLAADLDSGKFQAIKERYKAIERPYGDYCFLVFQSPTRG